MNDKGTIVLIIVIATAIALFFFGGITGGISTGTTAAKGTTGGGNVQTGQTNISGNSNNVANLPAANQYQASIANSANNAAQNVALINAGSNVLSTLVGAIDFSGSSDDNGLDISTI